MKRNSARRPTMGRVRLTLVGKSLFPDAADWRKEVAAALAVNPVTVKRWLAANRVPLASDIALECLLDHKQKP